MKPSRITLGSAGLSILAGLLWWQAARSVAVVRHPRAVMGTSCQLVAVVPNRSRARADRWLGEAESVLRRLEAEMSSWIDTSEISRLNTAPVGEVTGLSAETLEVLRTAREAYDQTGGAFDVTCRPLVLLWRTAGRAGRMPTGEEIAAARAASSWEQIELAAGDVLVKHRASCCVDLGGIAKGYAIDAATRSLGQPAVRGGLVDVGGDARLFGWNAQGYPWSVAVKNPFGPGALLDIEVGRRAVCTSGDYARGIEIEGQRLSHIIDPRTGRPARAAASVTVLAPTALAADVWATAMSVLGPTGWKRLPDRVEALMIIRTDQGPRLLATPGMMDSLPNPLPKGIGVEIRNPNDITAKSDVLSNF